MKKVENVIVAILDMIGMVFLSMTVILVAGNVVYRAILQTPIKGSYEMAGYFTSLFVSVSLPMCMVLDSHIKVDMITSHLKPVPKEILDFFARLVDLAISAAFTVGGYRQVQSFIVSGAVTDTLHFQIWPFKLVWCICTGIMCVAVILKIITLHSSYKRMKEQQTLQEGGEQE